VNENDKRHYSKEDYRELAAPFIKQQSVINTRSLQIQNPTKRKLHPQRKKSSRRERRRRRERIYSVTKRKTIWKEYYNSLTHQRRNG